MPNWGSPWGLNVAIPSYEDLMLPMLRLLADGRPRSMREVRDELAARFHLTDEELAQPLPSNQGNLFGGRVHWAKTYLQKAGLLQSPGRGVTEVTARGKAVAAEQLDRLTTRLLSERFQELRDWRNASRSPATKRSGEPDASVPEAGGLPVAPEEAIAAAIAELRRAIEEELLARLLQVSPAMFERLVLTLLRRLGYGGAVEAGQHIGRPGDGGVDGVIREDTLGLDIVYVQAKRWQGAVGSPTVLEFAGALSAHRARKGVLITTSTFTREALATAGRVDARIVLIDGPILARHMYDTGLGLTTVSTYEIKRVDSDFFDE